ncbi:major capsid protein [Bacillus phage BCPST]|uniref:Major capsid protein n=1 Tax=Bacillus phage BCPST TaxID=2801506 RepID=A0AAE7TQX8_9CAUD|nr:major capsid protein [Bacillus phage BCPST]QQO38685.1 major capsid protein [Bacillus phage BCPST]
MAELNYPQYVFEDEVWIASTQAFVCRMVGYGADINKYPARYQPIVKNGDCPTFMAEYEAYKASQQKQIIEQEAKQIQDASVINQG